MRNLLFAFVLALSACGSPPDAPPAEAKPELSVEAKSSTAPEAAPAAAPAPAPAPEATPAGGAKEETSVGNPALTDPGLAKKTAPDVFKAKFETTKGDFVIEVHREWAPNGADRFYNLVDIVYYDKCMFFRAIDGFLVQWGINGDPDVNDAWRPATISDDPVVKGNKKGFVTFAKQNRPNTRTTQLFINFVDNSNLDSMGFASFGEVVEGKDVVNSLYTGYGEGAPRGRGPDQGRVQSEGNAYLDAEFPKLDYIKTATIQ